MPERTLDNWAAWLLHIRDGDDPAERKRTLERLAKVRDRVLDNAMPKDGETLLDVGTGEGLVGFGALNRVGERGQVVFSDISRDLLDYVQALAEDLGVSQRCRFVQGSADNLSPIADESVDVVTTRSVLAYVAEKKKAIGEFARVLRPGGRISLYEPINRHFYPEAPHLFWGYDVSPVQDLAARVFATGSGAETPDEHPMLDFDERDLIALAERAGFSERHLELRMDVTPKAPQSWETFVRSSPNPLMPPLADAMADALNLAERRRFTQHLRPLVERGDGTFSVAVAYLWATRGRDPSTQSDRSDHPSLPLP